MATRIIQRTPDLGLKIRLTPLQPSATPESAEPAPVPAPEPTPEPERRLIWNGMVDADGNEMAALRQNVDSAEEYTRKAGGFVAAVLPPTDGIVWTANFSVAWDDYELAEGLSREKDLMPTEPALQQIYAANPYLLAPWPATKIRYAEQRWLAPLIQPAGSVLLVAMVGIVELPPYFEEAPICPGTLTVTASIGGQTIGQLTLELIQSA